jgi:H+/Cl- antiporter ClcA
MLAYGGTFTSAPNGEGYDFAPTQDAFFWTMVGIIVAGFVVACAGAIVQFVAWIGALVNSYQLQDKLWFVLTLILGLIGFGLVMMIVYLIAAPDGYEEQERIAGTQAAPPTLAPTT